MAQEPNESTEPAVVVSPQAGPGNVLMVQQKLPETLFVFPLRRAVPFPNLMMPVLLDTARAREIVQKAEAQSAHVLLIAQKDGTKDEPGPEDFQPTGVIAR